MAHRQGSDADELAGAANPTGAPPFRWDGSQVQSAYANVIRADVTRDEISLSFGIQHALGVDGAEMRVQGLRRICLDPSTVQQLAVALTHLVRGYEERFDPLDRSEPATISRDARSNGSGLHTPAIRTAEEQADNLFRLLQGLNVELGFERSFKMSEGSLLGNRFLLGFNTRAIPDSPGAVLDVCRHLHMPPDFQREFEGRLPEASYVHFGFEEGETACLYKAYLEFGEKSGLRMAARPDANSRLLHLGFKWDAQDPARKTTTRYTWHPWIPLPSILERAAAILDPQSRGHAWEITRGILDLAAERIPCQDILYLEVAEAGNPRRSFDINMYRANLQVSELYPLLLRMSRRYSIPLQRFLALYEPTKQKTFGHLSGGIDREGRDFLTVYYGVESLAPSRRPSGIAAGGFAGSISRPSAGGGHSPSIGGVELTDEKAGLLFRLAHDLGVRVARERSLKFRKNDLLADRYLVGFERKGADTPSDGRILDTCRRIDMPKEFLSTFQEWLPEATIVLFGFERSEHRLYKAYLEFGKKMAVAFQSGPTEPEPFLIHLGFKWDAEDNSRKTRARYTCVPILTPEDILTRISGGFYGEPAGRPMQIVEWVIRLAASRADPEAFLYFEAEEDGNPRASFDINMYRARLRMAELYPLLREICRHYAIPDAEFQSAYEKVKGQNFGHLTGGIDREGRDFLTVYCGERGAGGEGQMPRL